MAATPARREKGRKRLATPEKKTLGSVTDIGAHADKVAADLEIRNKLSAEARELGFKQANEKMSMEQLADLIKLAHKIHASGRQAGALKQVAEARKKELAERERGRSISEAMVLKEKETLRKAIEEINWNRLELRQLHEFLRENLQEAEKAEQQAEKYEEKFRSDPERYSHLEEIIIRNKKAATRNYDSSWELIKEAKEKMEKVGAMDQKTKRDLQKLEKIKEENERLRKGLGKVNWDKHGFKELMEYGLDDLKMGEERIEHHIGLQKKFKTNEAADIEKAAAEVQKIRKSLGKLYYDAVKRRREKKAEKEARAEPAAKGGKILDFDQTEINEKLDELGKLIGDEEGKDEMKAAKPPGTSVKYALVEKRAAKPGFWERRRLNRQRKAAEKAQDWAREKAQARPEISEKAQLIRKSIAKIPAQISAGTKVSTQEYSQIMKAIRQSGLPDVTKKILEKRATGAFWTNKRNVLKEIEDELK